MAVHGVGIDVADVDRITRLLDSYGERFSGRWFTPAEVAECDAADDRGTAFAARFAAKEAVWKALGASGGGPVPWAQIAVLGLDRRPRVELSGELAELATGLGVGSISISCSTSGRVVTAVVIAASAVD